MNLLTHLMADLYLGENNVFQETMFLFFLW